MFLGTLELATMGHHKFEHGWVEVLGLERKDLRVSRDTDVSFEYTANNDFDPDKRLVDKLTIPGENEMMDKEAARVNGLVRQLFVGRVNLPGGAGNLNESSIRRQFHRPPFCPVFQDEDIFFAFDLRKYLTEDSMKGQIAVARSFFINHCSVEDSISLEIPATLFKALRNSSLPTQTLPEEILKVVSYIPSYSFIKYLLNENKAILSFIQESQYLATAITPFRIVRFAEQLIKCVIHEVAPGTLKPQFFPRHGHSRPQSAMTPYTPAKRSRIDDSLCSGNTIRYFAAHEVLRKVG